MENVIGKQVVNITESGERKLQIIGIIAFMMVAALLVDLMEAPILAAKQSYASIVRFHGKEAVQIEIPVITAVFGVYEFAYAPDDDSVGYKRPILRKEWVGHLQPVLLAIG